MKKIIYTLICVSLVVACFCAPLVGYALSSPVDQQKNVYYLSPTIQYFSDYEYELHPNAPLWTIDGFFPTAINSTSMKRDYIPLTPYNGNVIGHRVNRYALLYAGQRIGDEIRLFPDGATHVEGVLNGAQFTFTIGNFWNNTAIALNYSHGYDDLIPSLRINFPSDVFEKETDHQINYTISVTYIDASDLYAGNYSTISTDTEIGTIYSSETSARKISLLPSGLENCYILDATLQIDATAVVYGGTNLNVYIASDESLSSVSYALHDYADGGWISPFMERFGIEETVDFEDISWTSWLGNAVGGVFDVPLFGGATLGTILGICVALGVVMFFLKKFAGG